MGKKFGKFLLFAGLAAAGGAAAYYFKKKKDDEFDDDYFDDIDDFDEEEEDESDEKASAQSKRDYVTLDKEPSDKKSDGGFVPLNETLNASSEEEFL